jgi:hypothetical protein
VFGLSTWESVARRGICGAGADIAGAGCAAGDAGEVATAGTDDDGESRKFGVGVACCRRREIPEEDFASTATGDENGMHSVPCQGSLTIVSTVH